MAQENLHMFKRLKEKTSYYDFEKYDKEYEQAQYYKRSHCSYLPSIDFNKHKRKVPLHSKNQSLRYANYDYMNNYNYTYNINNTNNNHTIDN